MKCTAMLIAALSVFAAVQGVFSPAARAQANNEIIVTAQRVSGDDYSSMPAVTLQKRADFLVQLIRLTNDTRDEETRKKELYDTIRDLLAKAGKKSGIAFGYGDEFLIPITAKNYTVPFRRGRRPDTIQTSIYVKMALGEKKQVTQSIESLQAFIENARVSGRTEIEPVGDIALSMVDPEKYRYEIIAKIAEDAKRLQSVIGARCKVNVSGLSNRVSWQRTDISELTLYIGYEIGMAGCQ